MIIWGARVGNRFKNYITTRFNTFTRGIFAIRYTLLNLDVYSYFLIKESFHHCNGQTFTSICIYFYVVSNILQSNVALPFFQYILQKILLPALN